MPVLQAVGRGASRLARHSAASAANWARDCSGSSGAKASTLSRAARYAVCAGKQGKFWGFHDQVFDNQDALSPSFLEGVAQKLGVNMETFKVCLMDATTNAQLQKEMQWAEERRHRR